MNASAAAPHPMSHYVRILARGKLGARNYTEQEAQEAMQLILSGQATDVQIGAVLMLLRVKEETFSELVGFVKAVQLSLVDAHFVTADQLAALTQPTAKPVLDWPSYAGKRKQQPWFVLSQLILAAHGFKVFVHGAKGHTHGRLYTQDVYESLGFKSASSAAEAVDQLQSLGLSFMPTEVFSPVLARLVNLRNEFGVRSPVHTLLRLVNPLQADFTLQSIFHPGYQSSHLHAAQALGYQNSMVIKGEGGEFERNPDARTQVLGLQNGHPYAMRLPLRSSRTAPETQLSAAALKQAWISGTFTTTYAEQATLETLALALITLKQASSFAEALKLAKTLWQTKEQASKFEPLSSVIGSAASA